MNTTSSLRRSLHVLSFLAACGTLAFLLGVGFDTHILALFSASVFPFALMILARDYSPRTTYSESRIARVPAARRRERLPLAA